MQPTPAPTSPPGSPPPEDSEAVDTDYPATPQHSKGPSPPFGALVGLFERLQNERRQDKRKKLINSWFNHWRAEVGDDLFPVLRLILPQKDRDRSVYGLKEKNLAKTYIKLIPLGRKDEDALSLLNWKKPTEREAIVKKRSSVIEGSMNIEEVNDILDELSKAMGKQDVQSKILQRVYNRTTPDEQRWIVRVILKDMVISVKETTVFAVFHPDAQDLFNTCSDLKKVAWTLYDPNFRLHADNKMVQLFAAFTPMLCKRPTKTIEHTVKDMQGSEFVIEEKLDGERMQLHKRGNEYFYCSRKGKDYTYMYGKHVGEGSLTPFLAKAFDERVDNIILDGEMLVWDPVSERNLPFGTLKTAALDKSKKENNPRPCFKIFDMLYLNGQSLLHKTTSFRKKNMRSCMKEIKGRIEFAVEYKGKTAKDVRMRMDEVMAQRGEGLVIKHPLSKYILNGRNADWIKVKPEYMEGMGETVDVLVVAGNYGTGSRGGGVSTLICAVVDDRRPDNDDEPCYSTFVRIGSGLSFSDYAWIRGKPWKVRDAKNPPEWLQTSKKGNDDKGDVYLEPEDSFILKVKAAEITGSEILERLRSEKKRKMEDTKGVATKKRKTTAKKPEALSHFRDPNPGGVQVSNVIFQGLTFVVMTNPKSRTAAAERTELVKTILANGGKQAQVVTSNHEPQDLIVVYDGTSTPSDVKAVINKGVFDIFKPSWINDSVALGHKAPFKKKYFFHASSSREFEDEGDQDEDTDMAEAEAGPSFTTEIETRSQTADIEVKEEKEDLHADWFKEEEETETLDINAGPEDSATEDDSDNDDVAGEAEPVDDDIDDETKEDVEMLEESKMGENEEAMEYDQEFIFRHLCFYLDSPENAGRHGMVVKGKYSQEINQSLSEVKDLILEHGGRIVDLDDPKLTSIIMDKRDTSRRLELMRRTAKPKHRRLIVSDYVEACIEEKTLLNEEDFVP
ncbi:DNA ligase 4 [Gymnopus androsaceus JB14]|uniref:DNA ligase n=1 Tax=Gymnopus androsaceus JB14 TaxID=1447944 RepID=A0A6A4HTE2_9AGAR|nr:DNA ligase 4 [Gymnopus androsaceus JB14]